VHERLLEVLRCPVSGSPLRIEHPEYSSGQIEAGSLVDEAGKARYPIVRGIPRFVAATNYADSFGMQWNLFRQTQLDSYSGHPISADRFWNATGWTPRDCAGQWVLDAGCGAGRFAEVMLNAGAQVVALDYSSAVDACYANLRHHPNLHVVQGDLYALPFARGSFRYVYSLGVLQHTPDVAAAVAALPPMLTPGGHLCIDFYERSWRGRLLPRYWLRPLTTRLPKERLFALLQRWIGPLWRVSTALQRVPLLGRYLHRLVPVANYTGILPLSEQQLREWALLDTFDWFSPAYDNPQTSSTIRTWLGQSGLVEVEVLKAGHLTGRGRRP
jgi:SAM-dependent methyltransferase